jgi:hypothetical protein
VSTETVCIWILSDRSNPDFEAFARYFGIWHEHSRGAHGGLHEFYFNSNHILLLNVMDPVVSGVPTYGDLKPTDIRPLRSSDFRHRIMTS